jgi:hypothetical protein
MNKISNRRLVTTEGPDFYPTPEWGTAALLKYETFNGNILEPCCGDGAMSRVLWHTNCTIFSSDIYDRGYGSVHDIFDIEMMFDNVVTNPPYNIALEIIQKSLSIVRQKACFLVRTAFLESASRFEALYSKNPPNRVYIFSERLSMYPKGYDVQGGGTTSYSWLVWDKEAFGASGTQLVWIEPGLKPNSRFNK